jgi:hypothetical protein
VQDERVGCPCPLLCRQGTAELILDHDRIVRVGDPEPIGHPKHVAIHGKAGDVERVAEHDVGSLAADAGEGRQLFDIGRHVPPVSSNECLGHSDQRPGLGPKKPGGVNEGLDLGSGRLREGVRVRKSREHARRHLIDALVRGLCRKDSRDEQLKRVSVVKLGVGAWVLRFKRREDLPGVSWSLQ